MYSKLRHFEQKLVATARQLGYDGSPFLRDTPPLGMPEQELAAIELSLSIRPRPQTPKLRKLVRWWARNIVLSSDYVPVNLPEQKRNGKFAGKFANQSMPTTESKLDRVRRRRAK